MFHQSLNGFETIWTKKHDGEIAGDAVKTWQARRQRAHIQAFEPQPRELRSLDRSRALNLTPTEIDGQDLPRGPHLLCQVERWNPVAAGDIENGSSRAKIQMLQQRLSEGGGPIVVGRKRPTRPDYQSFVQSCDSSAVMRSISHTPPLWQGPPVVLRSLDDDHGRTVRRTGQELFA